jgi:hypothetical protein
MSRPRQAESGETKAEDRYSKMARLDFPAGVPIEFAVRKRPNVEGIYRTAVVRYRFGSLRNKSRHASMQK